MDKTQIMADLRQTHLAVHQAATVLGVSPSRVHQLIRAGALAVLMTPIGRLVAKDAVAALAAQRSRRAADTCERVTPRLHDVVEAPADRSFSWERVEDGDAPSTAQTPRYYAVGTAKVAPWLAEVVQRFSDGIEVVDELAQARGHTLPDVCAALRDAEAELGGHDNLATRRFLMEALLAGTGVPVYEDR